jgi:hypothetical protein
MEGMGCSSAKARPAKAEATQTAASKTFFIRIFKTFPKPKWGAPYLVQLRDGGGPSVAVSKVNT